MDDVTKTALRAILGALYRADLLSENHVSEIVCALVDASADATARHKPVEAQQLMSLAGIIRHGADEDF